MFTKKIFTLLAITLLGSVLTASEINAQEKTIFVDGKQFATSTGDTVNAGDMVEVLSIAGEFKYAGSKPAVTYAGTENPARASSQFEYPDAAPYSLVGFVGEKKNHFQVYTNLKHVAGNSGVLNFGINDTNGQGHLGDNSGGYTVKYRIVKNNGSKTLAFQSVNNPKMYVHYNNGLGDLSTSFSTFKLVRGLTGEADTVSFESVEKPGYFLRHQGFRIKLHPNENSDMFKKDSTFRIVPGLAGKGNSYESVNFPGNYIRHCSYQLFIDNNKRNNGACNIKDDVYKGDVSFITVEK